MALGLTTTIAIFNAGYRLTTKRSSTRLTNTGWTIAARTIATTSPRDEGKMQEIMARYNIPRDVPCDVIASAGRGY